MLRKCLLGLGASFMTLSAFTATVAIMGGGGAPAVSQEIA